MASTDGPRRREVWLVALGAGRTGAPADLIVIVPLSSSLAPSGLRVDMAPIAGIDRPSRAICRAVRAVVSSRFVRRIGSVEPETMEQIETALALILGLGRTSTPG